MDRSFIKSDQLIFTPDDVDLSYSPLRKGLNKKTYVLGAFNPGLCRLPNGNLLLMVRIAEALSKPFDEDMASCIRWDPKQGFTTDAWPLHEVSSNDPRKFKINTYTFPVYALTSLSWLLPVELNEDGSEIIGVHYDKVISSSLTGQEYGIEDARISFIDNRYYMTACCVSSERHSTMLYISDDGLNYNCLGVVLDHQNKDMLLFEGKVNNHYYSLTRPLGECYFTSAPSSDFHPGAGIQLASSPDLLHWKPCDVSLLRARKSSISNVKLGGGTPPVLTSEGWLMLYHGVENKGAVGIYRTFWALLDRDDPSKILYLEDTVPLLEANSDLTHVIRHQVYLNDVVFTTGISEHEDEFIIASGELDLACRITRISKKHFRYNVNK
ncbi:MAG: glycosidase [Chitinophagales bacterium]|nr:glycosidase [Chitinophagales bacterium]